MPEIKVGLHPSLQLSDGLDECLRKKRSKPLGVKTLCVLVRRSAILYKVKE